jgi:serine/threonine protein kinase
MEFVRSRSLAQIVQENGPLPPQEVARVGLQVLAALRAAHSAGILHRDVKPANVLLGDYERVVLTDFGIATLEGDSSLTRSGTLLGSPAYIAPERTRGKAAGPASDLWSLGATLYTAVEGRPPYDRGGPLPTVTAVATEDPDPLVLAGPLVPALNGLLRKDPAERLDAWQAARLLREVAHSLHAPPHRERLRPAPAIPPARDLKSGQRTRVFPAQPVPEDQEASTEAADRPEEQPATTADLATSATSDTSAASAPPTAPARPTSPGRDPSGRLLPAAPPTAAESPTPTDPTEPPAESPTPAESTEPPAQPTPSAEAPAAEPWRPIGPAKPKVAPRSGRIGVPDADRRKQWLTLVGVVLALAGSVSGTVWLWNSDVLGTSDKSIGLQNSQNRSPSTSDDKPTSPKPSVGIKTVPTPTPTSAAVPPGFVRHRDAKYGFSLAIPKDWRVTHEGDLVYIREQGGTRFLQISQTDQPKPDAVKDWTRQEVDRRTRLSNYQRIRIDPVPNYFIEAADWEYTFTDARGQPRHTVSRGVVTSRTQAYGLYWSTPASQWKLSYSLFQTFVATFQPAPGA